MLVSPLSSGRDVADKMGLAWLLWGTGGPFDSTAKIGALKAPLLVIHGDADNVLPLEMGQRLFGAAAVEKKMLVFRGAGHNDLVDRDPARFFDTIGTFLEKVAPR